MISAKRTRQSIRRSHHIGVQGVIAPLARPVHRPVQIDRRDVGPEMDMSARQPISQDLDEAGPVKCDSEADLPFDLFCPQLAQPSTARGPDSTKDGGGPDGPQRSGGNAPATKNRNGVRPQHDACPNRGEAGGALEQGDPRFGQSSLSRDRARQPGHAATHDDALHLRLPSRVFSNWRGSLALESPHGEVHLREAH